VTLHRYCEHLCASLVSVVTLQAIDPKNLQRLEACGRRFYVRLAPRNAVGPECRLWDVAGGGWTVVFVELQDTTVTSIIFNGNETAFREDVALLRLALP